MSMLDFSVPDDVVQSVDFSGFEYVQTGVYRMKITTAFLDAAKSGAKFVRLEGNLVPEGHDNKGGTIRQDVYFTSKDNKAYYTSNGKNFKLPGLDMLDALCEFATGKMLAKQNTEEKLVEVFVNGEKQQVRRDVLIDLIGVDVLVAVEKIKDNKKKQNSMTGAWEPEFDSNNQPVLREFNEIAKVFSDKGFTYAETLAGATETKWKTNFEKFTGQDKDRSAKIAKSAASAPIGNKPPLGSPNQTPPSRTL